MTDKQPEAQRLADDLEILEDTIGDGICKEAATELRRLYEENEHKTKVIAALAANNQGLLDALKYYAYTHCEGWCKESPVSREDIKDCGGCFARITIDKYGEMK